MKNNQPHFNGRSKTNGIVFYSTKFPFWGIETSIDEDGNFNSTFIPSYNEPFYCYTDKEHSKVKKWKIIVFNTLIILSSVIAFIFSQNINFILSALVFSVFVTAKFFDLIKITFENTSQNN